MCIVTHSVSFFGNIVLFKYTANMHCRRSSICPGNWFLHKNKDSDSYYRTHPAVQRSFCNVLMDDQTSEKRSNLF